MAEKSIRNYDFKEDLARGRYAMIKLCVDNNKPDRVFVAKVVTKVGGKYSRLQREHNICKTLIHENVIRLLYASEDERTNFLLFELMATGDLEQYINERQFLNESEASLFTKQILEGIKYIHHNNVIHRNLRAENILVGRKQNAIVLKIAGFGLAVQCSDDQYKSYSPIGVSNFMAPEIIKKQTYGKPVDIWSAAILTYRLLVGYCPFEEKKKERLMRKILTLDYEFDPPEWSSVSIEAKTFIETLLTLDPNKRPTAVQALANIWISNVHDITAKVERRINLFRIDNFNAKRKLLGLIIALRFAVIVERSKP